MAELPSTENSSTTASPAETPKKTSRAGRIIIGLLLVVLAFEGVSYARLLAAQSKLSSELGIAEAADHKVSRADVKQLLGGREPDLSKVKRGVAAGEELYDVYYFNGLLKRRVLCVHYGVTGERDADDSQREMMEVMTIIPEEILFEAEPAG